MGERCDRRRSGLLGCVGRIASAPQDCYLLFWMIRWITAFYLPPQARRNGDRRPCCDKTQSMSVMVGYGLSGAFCRKCDAKRCRSRRFRVVTFNKHNLMHSSRCMCNCDSGDGSIRTNASISHNNLYLIYPWGVSCSEPQHSPSARFFLSPPTKEMLETNALASVSCSGFFLLGVYPDGVFHFESLGTSFRWIVTPRIVQAVGIFGSCPEPCYFIVWRAEVMMSGM